MIKKKPVVKRKPKSVPKHQKKRSITTFGSKDHDLGEYKGVYERFKIRLQYYRSIHRQETGQRYIKMEYMQLMLYLLDTGMPMCQKDFAKLLQVTTDRIDSLIVHSYRDFDVEIVWIKDPTMYTRGYYRLQSWGVFDRDALRKRVISVWGFSRIDPIAQKVKEDVEAKGGITRTFNEMAD